MEHKTPWYIKKKALYVFCILTPPIGYLILITNLKKLEHHQKIEYLSIATIMMAIWSLKLLPEALNNFVWAIIISILVGSAIIKFVKNNKQNK